MRHIDKIIIHCSDTYIDMDIGVDEIREWHVKERKWSDVGYHYIIRRDGKLEKGRDDITPGAHARGYNKQSLGICMVGGKSKDNKPESNFTAAQWASLFKLCGDLRRKHNAEIIGHNDVSKKACPCFNVKAWADGLERS